MDDHAPTSPTLVLQHGPDGPPGLLGDWLAARGRPARTVRADRDPLPGVPAHHAAIVLLGSPHGDPEPTWVADELAFVVAAVAADVPVLGICWGAQVLTRALGGEVRPGTETRRGWFEIATEDPAIESGPWAHHHRDVALEPLGGRATAFGPRGPAAFRHGRHLGVQFHPEATATMVACWDVTGPPCRLPEPAETGAQGAPGGDPASPAHRVPGAAEARDRAFGFFDAWWSGATRS